MILSLLLLAQCPDVSVTAPAGDFYDDLGASVALDGDLLVAGMPRQDTEGDDGDCAVVFRRTAAGWIEDGVLFASDGDQGVDFGFSVAAADMQILVGDPRAPVGGGYLRGAAYLFERPFGEWFEVQKLVSAEGQYLDHFGYSVALSADATRAVVGAPNFHGGGEVVVFDRRDGVFVQTAVIPRPDGPAPVTPEHNFGVSVCVEDDRIVVGDPDVGEEGPIPAGAGYVFDLVDGDWVHTATLEPAAGTLAGQSVAISGDVVVLGVPGDWRQKMLVEEPAGFAVPFRETEAGWQQEAVVSAPELEVGMFLGASVDVEGDRMLIAEPMHDVGGGRVRLYRWDGSVWGLEALLDPDAPGQKLGRAVALSGAHAAVGVPQEVTAYIAWMTSTQSTGPGEVRVWPLPTGGHLWGDAAEASLSGGGTQVLQLTTCPPRANDTYLLLGSLSGTSPGIPVDGLVLPLAPDSYTSWLLANPSPAHLPGSLGSLDAVGAASTTMTVPAGSPAAWAGGVFQHAFAVVSMSSGTPQVVQVSNAAPLALVP